MADGLAIVRRRIREQRLTGRPLATPADVVGHLGAVQSQEFAEATWSVSERTAGLTAAEVGAAFDRGEILRTHVLRPTWHFVTPADIRWMLTLSAPRVHAGNRSRYRDLGLDTGVLARSHEVLARELADGDPRTRPELGAALAAGGIDVEGQRLAHTVMHAELEQLVASGPRRGKQHTYLLLDHRAPAAAAMSPAEPRAEIARRYFTSHGPATIRDFSWWSGLTMADSRAGAEALGGALDTELAEDGVAWHAPPVATGEARGDRALLVPLFDELTVAYRDLRMAGRAGAGNELNRWVVIDGEAVGAWRRRVSARAVVIEVTLSRELKGSEPARLESAASRLGEFLELPVTLHTLPGA